MNEKFLNKLEKQAKTGLYYDYDEIIKNKFSTKGLKGVKANELHKKN